MNHIIKTLAAMIAVLSIAALVPPAFASEMKSAIPSCDQAADLDVSSRREVVGGFEQLPKMILVGRIANHIVEDREKDQTILLHGRQSFVNAKSEILCATTKTKDAKTFSLYAPTLIDLSKKSGTSFWQFQLMANATQVGIWNAKSRIESKTDLTKFVKSLGAQARLYQISHDQYELVLSKENGGHKETLSIVYDVTK